MSGKLNPGAGPVRTFIDTFPAGALSGASRRVEVRIRFSSIKCRSFMDIEVRIRFLSMKCRSFMDIEVLIRFLSMKCRCFMDTAPVTRPARDAPRPLQRIVAAVLEPGAMIVSLDEYPDR